MTSKTPQFNKALEEIFADLKPHTKKCGWCGVDFEIQKEDIDFYRMLRVPPPKLCPYCRKKRRFGHLMRVPKFFKKECRAPGHDEKVISVLPPATAHKVYDFAFWQSDEWDPTAFGTTYKSGQSFFEQFKALFFAVPQVPLDRDTGSINSEYAVGGLNTKNAYYCSMAYKSENVAYCFDVEYSKDCVDCSQTAHSELCYSSVVSDHCNSCSFIVECSACINSFFLYDCKNCSRCFLSSNLRNKSFVFENQQLSEEEYKKKIALVNLGDRKVLEYYINRFDELAGRALHRSVRNVNAVHAVGDRLTDVRNCYFCFNVFGGSQNLRYVDNAEALTDAMDATNSVKTENIYESIVIIGRQTIGSMYCRNSSYLEYCSNCYDCHYCFGCVGLKNKKFHIFDKPYPEAEYWQKVDEIKSEMLKRGEYGEFFPLELGLFPYQSSNGQKDFPLSEETAKKSGIPWYPEPGSDIPENMNLRQAPEEVPDFIGDVSDEIMKDAIICEITKKPFRLIKSELDFYRKMNLPLPTKHPWTRMRERARLEHAWWLYPFTCSVCGEKSYTVYEPARQKELKIYCEKCYLKEVV